MSADGDDAGNWKKVDNFIKKKQKNKPNTYRIGDGTYKSDKHTRQLSDYLPKDGILTDTRTPTPPKHHLKKPDEHKHIQPPIDYEDFPPLSPRDILDYNPQVVNNGLTDGRENIEQSDDQEITEQYADKLSVEDSSPGEPEIIDQSVDKLPADDGLPEEPENIDQSVDDGRASADNPIFNSKNIYDFPEEPIFGVHSARTASNEYLYNILSEFIDSEDAPSKICTLLSNLAYVICMAGHDMDSQIYTHWYEHCNLFIVPTFCTYMSRTYDNHALWSSRENTPKFDEDELQRRIDKCSNIYVVDNIQFLIARLYLIYYIYVYRADTSAKESAVYNNYWANLSNDNNKLTPDTSKREFLELSQLYLAELVNAYLANKESIVRRLYADIVNAIPSNMAIYTKNNKPADSAYSLIAAIDIVNPAVYQQAPDNVWLKIDIRNCCNNRKVDDFETKDQMLRIYLQVENNPTAARPLGKISEIGLHLDKNKGPRYIYGKHSIFSNYRTLLYLITKSGTRNMFICDSEDDRTNISIRNSIIQIINHTLKLQKEKTAKQEQKEITEAKKAKRIASRRKWHKILYTLVKNIARISIDVNTDDLDPCVDKLKYLSIQCECSMTLFTLAFALFGSDNIVLHKSWYPNEIYSHDTNNATDIDKYYTEMYQSIGEFITKIKINPTMIVEIWGSIYSDGKNSRPRIYEFAGHDNINNIDYETIDENIAEMHVGKFMTFIFNEYSGPRYGRKEYFARFIHKIYVIKLN